MRFDQAEIAAAVGSGALTQARLRLNINFNANNWGTNGRAVAVHRMLQAWTELGATWNCPDDTNTANSSPDCIPWVMNDSSQYPFLVTPTDVIAHENNLLGPVEWDVTADVQAFLAGAANHGWLIKKVDESEAGRVDYSSREGTVLSELILTIDGPPSPPKPKLLDTFIRQGTPNKAMGSEVFLRIKDAGNNRALIAFDQAELEANVGGQTLVSAKLRLTIIFNADNWGVGREVAVHRMLQGWTEVGATWNCADDLNTENTSPDCPAFAWDMTNSAAWPFDPTPTAAIVHVNGQLGEAEWDVTADVQAFLSGSATNYGWLVKKLDEGQPGHVEYSSREGAFPPQLILEFGEDTTPPVIAVSNPADGSFTNNSALTVTGQVDEPASVTVNAVAVALDANNAFSHSVTLTEGTNTITITATDAANNTSTVIRTVTLDTIVPVAADTALITVSDPVNGQVTVTGSAGSVEANATVTVTNTRTGETATVVADASGAFSAQLGGQTGDTYNVVVNDQAGNASAAVQVGSTPRAVAIISPEGGQVSLPGFATVTFPAGAFATSQQVELFITTDPQFAAEFTGDTFFHTPGPRTSYEVQVNTGSVAPATDFDVEVEIPQDLEAQLPAGHGFVVFSLVRQESAEDLIDNFVAFATTTFQPPSGYRIAGTKLPSAAFWDKRNAQGTFGAVIVLSTIPIQPVIDTSALIDKFGVTAGRSCVSRSDVRKVLAPPLDGNLVVTSSFGKRLNPDSGEIEDHYGTDYATRDAAGNAIEGLDVRALDDGVVTAVVVQQPKNRFVPQGVGWGQLVAIRHSDGSQSLYAHLQLDQVLVFKDNVVAKDQIIAKSGQTGGARGPHLHVEFIPNGETLITSNDANPLRVDPAPCIRRDLYVAKQSFTNAPGFVNRYDTTQNFSMTPLPSGLTANATRAVAAFNTDLYVTGATEVARNGSVLSLAGLTGKHTSGIGTNRLGFYVTDDDLDLGGCCSTDARIHRFDYQTLSTIPPLEVLGEFSDRVLAVSDERIVDIAGNKASIFNTAGAGIGSGIIPDLIFFAGTATKDRIFLADHDTSTGAFQAIIKVYDNNGAFSGALPSPIPGRVFGLAATEKRLYVSQSDFGKILVFERVVTRDNTGQIINEQYSSSPIAELSEPGFPMGLGVE